MANLKIDHSFGAIRDIEDLKDVSRDAIWQNFENLVAFIFEENGYRIKVNTVKSFNKKRRQYDVIAKKSSQVFLVECKKWSGNRYRLSALKAAAKRHRERANFYNDMTKENAIPVIVTLIEEDIKFHEGIPIIPIFKLNSFIGEIDRGVDDSSMIDE